MKVTITNLQLLEKLKELYHKLDLIKELQQNHRSHSKISATMRVIMRTTKMNNMKEALMKIIFPFPHNLDKFNKILMKWREELVSLILINIQLQKHLKLKITKRILSSKKFHLKLKMISQSNPILTLTQMVYQKFLLEMNRKTKKS